MAFLVVFQIETLPPAPYDESRVAELLRAPFFGTSHRSGDGCCNPSYPSNRFLAEARKTSESQGNRNAKGDIASPR